MSIEINKELASEKEMLIDYFRDRGEESLRIVKEKYGEKKYKKRASAINKEVTKARRFLIKNLLQTAKHENWDNQALLDCILMVTYSSYVVMLALQRHLILERIS